MEKQREKEREKEEKEREKEEKQREKEEKNREKEREKEEKQREKDLEKEEKRERRNSTLKTTINRKGSSDSYSGTLGSSDSGSKYPPPSFLPTGIFI